MKEFLIKDTEAFKIRVNMSDCLKPQNLKHITFTGEQYVAGELIQDSSYEFFMTVEEIKVLCEKLQDSI